MDLDEPGHRSVHLDSLPCCARQSLPTWDVQGRSCYCVPTTINRSCDTTPVMSRWQLIMQPSLRGLWKTISWPEHGFKDGAYE